MNLCNWCRRKHTEIRQQTGLRTRLLGTTPGHWLTLFLAGCCIQLSCMLAWMLSGGNEDYDTGLRDSFWISYVLLVDIGTQTGFSPNESGVVRCVAVVISIVGFVYCLTFLGMVVDLMRSFLVHWKVKYSKVDAYDHLLILGWGDKTLFLLEELLDTTYLEEPKRRCCRCCARCCACCARFCGCCGRRHRRKIVILAERPVREMQREVRMHLRTKDPQGAAKKLGCISYREGCRSHRIELLKVNACLAQHILIMCAAETDSSSDHEAIRTLLALGALPTAVSSDVWTEMHNRESARVVNNILPAAQGIVARHAVNHMIALRALVPSVGFAWLRMSTTRSHPSTSLFLVPVPDMLVGVQFKEAFRHFPKAVVCGLKQALQGSQKLRLEAYALQAEDELIMLANSIGSAGHVTTELLESEEAEEMPKARRPNVLMPDGQIRLGPAADGPLVVLVIGCPDDFFDILDIIDSYVAAGSQVHLLSTRPLHWRQSCLHLHFSRTGKLQFDRISIIHHVGRRRNAASLDRLPLDSADCALILSEREDDLESGLDSDSRNLTIAINLKHVLDTKADVIGSKRRNSYRKKCKIVTEIQDSKTETMLAGNSSVRQVGSFLFSSATETGVFAIVPCHAHGFAQGGIAWVPWL
ncbi:unnamed protein product [Effrenium voratum]|nr:unnamed protein product [Effrenium voratum]